MYVHVHHFISYLMVKKIFINSTNDELGFRWFVMLVEAINDNYFFINSELA